MKKKKMIFLLMAFFILILCGCTRNTNEEYSASGRKLDTYVSVTLYSGGSEELAKEAVALCDKYDAIFSRTNENSLLYKLNNEGTLAIDSEDSKTLAELIEIGLAYGSMTDYSLDIAVEPLSSIWDFKNKVIPDEQSIAEALKNVDAAKVEITDTCIYLNGSRLDLGAIAKGYIADKIKEYLVDNGVKSGIINLGGNILCIGKRADRNDFSIGIKKPFTNSETILGLNINDESVVTSGNYERYFYKDDVLYHHILDPETGYPCNNNLNSVTIISKDSVTGDCLSTGCFVLGLDKGMEIINNMDDVYGIFIDKDNNIYYSEGAEAFVRG